MRQTGFFHHIGTFLLFAATVLLIITDISAPVVNSISILRIDLGNRGTSLNRHPSVTFGSFGYCVRDTLASGQDFCTRSQVGYDPTEVIEETVRGVDFSDAAADTARALTHVMVLHPIATGLAFISFLLALGAGVVGSFLASLCALLTFLVTLVALICDFVAFAVVKSAVNNNNSSSAHAEWGAAIWTVLVSAICSLLGTVVVFFTCCSGRMHRRREARLQGPTKVPDGYGAPVHRRRWFW